MSYLLDRWFPTSRGKVKCDICRAVIPKGEKYERQKSADGEQIWEVRTCQACEKVILEASQDLRLDEYTQEDIYEWAAEEIEGGKNQELAQQYLHRLQTGERE